jgi:hypothetical protein
MPPDDGQPEGIEATAYYHWRDRNAPEVAIAFTSDELRLVTDAWEDTVSLAKKALGSDGVRVPEPLRDQIVAAMADLTARLTRARDVLARSVRQEKEAALNVAE